jgi:hypothetical protein
MDTEIIVAIIVGITTVIAAIIAAYGTASAASRKLAISLAQVAVKVDTLWEIYAEEAIREARVQGIVAARSPEAPTDKFNDMVSSGLIVRIERHISINNDCDPYDMAIEVWNRYSEELLDISRVNDVSLNALFGAIYAMCKSN